jgi:hypothetical protein
MAHDTKRKTDDAPATYTGLAPDGFVAFGVSLPSGVPLTLVDAVMVVPLAANNRRNIAHKWRRDANVPKAVGVAVGMSEDGTAEIGMGAGLPAGGLYTERK